jgi:hypothetical protein
MSWQKKAVPLNSLAFQSTILALLWLMSATTGREYLCGTQKAVRAGRRLY